MTTEELCDPRLNPRDSSGVTGGTVMKAYALINSTLSV